ncbi:MAG: tRNA (N(6)-L-threonylcarbamoyladenosine(37)-C(2))-methylthiotransferase MtaB [Alphaproteobacteria bacterium]|nr:tRNA (N(6)-L-threonylcarbamoyladenosine(37)-C(2))-methylthiotransferase MtaB [Alphaproteobacteria bacterium]
MKKLSNKSKVINLGCRLNFFESEIIENILKKEKDVTKVVINTCAVTNNAVQKSLQAVKKALKDYPNSEVIVTGCASQVEKSRFKSLKKISRIIDNKFKTNPNSYVNKKKVKANNFNFPSIDFISTERTRAMLQIQQGCNHRCTFCIIPYGRGNAISLPFSEISKRVEKILKNGFTEIVLTGVDLTSYGEDLKGKPKLGNILKRLFKLFPNLSRLRLSSIDPAEIDEDLFDLFKFEKRLMPYLHLSLQSGDNLILKRMKRRHNREMVLGICNNLKSFRKNITFGADLIVGFPTETEEHFQNSMNLISKCQISNVHIFPFSPKEGTPAAKMPQVKKELINERVLIAKRFSENIKKKIMQNKIGMKETFLYESDSLSYTDNYFKVVLRSQKNKIKSGSLIRAKVISINDGKFQVEV